MIERDIINDVSTITFIDRKHLDKLVNKALYSIGDAACLFNSSEDNTLSLDIGIGTILLVYIDDSIKYKFIPSEKMEKVIISAVSENKNILINKLETNLISKIENIYKDLL